MRWNAYTNTHAHRYGYCDRYSYCHRYTYRNRGATSYSNTETSPDAGSAIAARSGAVFGMLRAFCSRHPASCWMHFPVCGECFGTLPKPAMRITKQYESSLGTDFGFDHPSCRYE